MMESVMHEESSATDERSLLKGMLAGMIGGLVATAAKTVAEKVYPPRVHGESEPTSVLVEKLGGHDLDEGHKAVAMEAIHWGFGALTGAAYGGLAEFFPAATSKDGASFGVALATLTHGSALPAIGLEETPEEQSGREQSSEMATHLLYGVVTESVRRIVRRVLD